MSKIGRRISFTDIGKVEILEHPYESPKAGQVLMETIVTAVSPGTELSRLYNTHMVPRPYPQNTGYLTVARAIEMGEGVEGIEIGKEYVVNMGHLSHHCVPASSLYALPTGVKASEAAFTNLMTVSMRAIRQAEIQLGSSVLIFGLGLIGQFAQLFARLNGATRVTCVDPSERRRKIAENTGLKNVLNSFDSSLSKKIAAVTDSGKYHVAIDSTGVASVFSGLPPYVEDFGTLLILGGIHKPVELDLYTHIQKRSLRLIGAGSPDPHNYPFDTAYSNQSAILDLLQNGSLNIDPLISHQVPVDEAPTMYRMLQEEKDKALGVVFEW